MMICPIVRRGALLVLLATLAATGCERERRDFREPPPAAGRVNSVTMTTLRPGVPIAVDSTVNPYEGQAYAISEGKRLYTWFNCVGCHSHGGGSMGPPLMDSSWIYGSDPANIFATIVEGRPNGMPSFRGKIPDYQVWQLVAYVRSLSGQVPMDAASGRDDDMQGKRQEQMKRQEKPTNAHMPPSSEGTE